MNRRLKRIESLKSKRSYDDTIKDIKRLILEKKVQKANDMVNSLLKDNEKDDKALMLSADLACCFNMMDFAVSQALKALEVNPMNEDALVLIAKDSYDKQDYDKAKDYFLKANRVNDANVEVSIGMANVCLLTKGDDNAEVFARSAIFLSPEDVVANIVYADVMRQKGNFSKAEEYYRKALIFDNKNVSARLGLAIILYSEGKHEDSVSMYRMIPQEHLSPRVLWNYSLVLLATGRWQLGYKYYIHGFETKMRQPNRMKSIKKPLWSGESLKNKTILIWREQGVGDELLFSYFYNEIIKKAGKVIIECEVRLVELFKSTFKDAEVRKQTCEVSEIMKDGDVIYTEVKEDYDYHVPSMQLPGMLYKSVSDVPDNNIPYIVIPEEIKQKWQGRVNELQGLKVGIIWRSGNIERARKLEYVAVEDLKKTFCVKDVSFVNLMYAKCDEEKQYIKDNYGASLHEWDDLDLKNNFMELLAMMSNLDVIITPSTTVVSLAGLVCVPTIMIGRGSWVFYGKSETPLLPFVKPVIKKSWDDDNSVIDEKMSEMLENFKTTRKL